MSTARNDEVVKLTLDNSNDSNRKDQLDEIQALESIYSDIPECFSHVINDDSLITGSITILLPKIDKGISIHAGEKIIRINYLPPLLLRFTFPRDYPSHSMPLFSLQASWLDSTVRHRLTKILIGLWMTYHGVPVLFTWVESLKEEIMQILSSEMSINLDEIVSEESITDAEKRKSDELLKTFIEFDDQATQDDFEAEWYDCEVCFASKRGKECIRFMQCGHVFCTECVSAYYHQKLQDNAIRQLDCLNDGCDNPATQAQIRLVFTDKEFEVYEQRLLEGTLDLMSDVVACPRISCQAPVIIDGGEGSSLASCSLCYYSFCVLCKKAYHGIESCSLTSESRLKLLDQLETATASQLDEIYRRYGGKKHLHQMLETLKSEQWIETNSKPCPSCQAKIEKNDGCNKMTCTKCGNYFCWLCGAVLNKKDPYAHFTEPGPNNCVNLLFEFQVLVYFQIYKWLLADGNIKDKEETSNVSLMPSLNWKHYTAMFAAVSGTPVFCYWYYSLPHVVDRFTEKWMVEEPERDNREFHEFMRELSTKRQKVSHAELVEKVTAEEKRRNALH
uniref:RBR-type E3 ubiquitin transferase n=1 Tax=Setaria digitata TaxID=48799 RepID=A0A915PSB3_9BILA